MPTATNEGVRLYYEAQGDGEPVAFVEDVGYGAWSWGWQHAAVAGPYEAVVWDNRGTGRSDAPSGPYAVADLVADLEAVLAAADARRAHLVGLGLGGMVALAHALAYDRARTLTLAGTAASGERVNEDALSRAHDAPRDSLDAALSAAFRADQPDAVEGIAEWRREGDASEAGRRAQAAAMTGFDAADRLHEVTVPALVVHGTDDAVVPPEAGRALAEGLPRGEWRPFEGASHLVTVERSRPVNDALLAFFADGSPE